MAGIINWKKFTIPSTNPDADHMYVGIDIADCLLYTKDSAGVVNKYPTSATVLSLIATALADYDLSTVVDSKISTAINNLIDGAPGTLDTLNELAEALADDENYATTIASEQATQDAALAQEISDRTAADSALQSQITSNDTDIAQNASDLSTETTNRINGDANLQSQITTANSDITTLQSDLSQEITDRTNADTALQSQITSNDGDITDLQNDKADQTDLTQEVSDRTAADVVLQNQITSNDSDITDLENDKADQADLTQEVSDRAAADVALQNQITTNDTDIANNASAAATAQLTADNHIADTANPHSVTKAQVGLGNADNTSDVDKPVSTAQQAALDLKADQTDLDNHVNDTTNPHSVTKTQVGLGNAENTSDANKPISTATQAALDLKYDDSNPNGYETPSELDARDTANRNRANHTNTQLASTISDFEQAVTTYLDRSSFQNNTEQINNTTTFNDRHNETITPAHTATYKITANYTWSMNNSTNNFEGELLIDGVIVRRHEQEAKDSGGTDGGSGTDQRTGRTFVYTYFATASTNFDVQLRFRSETAGVIAAIKDSTITIERWLE